MNLNELNTTQIILLVLLVSFVTSIATGIVTVSLLAQAPPAITQTVNRIIERTVETVVPTQTKTPAPIKETTIVVKEDDLITDSVTASLAKTGRVFAGTSTTTPVVGLASAISGQTLLADASVVSGTHLVSIGNTLALFSVSKRFPEIGVAILTPESTSTTLTLGSSFKISDVGAVKLGQTVIALVSVLSERVAIGAVSAKIFLADVVRKGADPVSVRAIDSNIEATLVLGTPLVNIFGDLVGISTSVSQIEGRGAFIAASDIIALLAEPKATSTSQ